MSAEEKKNKSKVRTAASLAFRAVEVTVFWSLFGPVLAYKLWRYHKREACKRD